MTSASFDDLESSVRRGGIPAMFDSLVEVLRREKRYPQLFDALLMKKRHEVGLPVEGAETVRGLSEEVQIELENFYIAACREVGALCLQTGDIPGAWPYFKAIDEPDPIGKAIDEWTPPEGGAPAMTDTIIDIALAQGASPRRGFEVLLQTRGPAKCVEALDRHLRDPGADREHCGCLLVRRIYEDVVRTVRAAIAEGEGASPEEESLGDLVESHRLVLVRRGFEPEGALVRSAIRIAAGLRDRRSIERAVELAEYGRLFPRTFPSSEPSPFEDYYADSRIFLLSLLGVGTEGAIRFFAKRAEQAFVGAEGKHVPGEVLVTLLWRAGRHSEAIDAYLKYLGDAADPAPTVPKLLDLCREAGDYTRFLERARGKGDVLQYALGLVRREIDGSRQRTRDGNDVAAPS
jgi:hypothetical protein